MHEIQNPLVAIKTFTRLLPTRGEDAAFRENVARIADREITRIEDLFWCFRIPAPASQPMEPIDATLPMQATLDLLAPRSKRVAFGSATSPTGRPGRMLGHASQLEQLFINLCLNALEAMGPRGGHRAGGRSLRGRRSYAAGRGLRYGSGIAEDLLPTIFNLFVTPKTRGSRLGLAICRNIADAHRATLSAQNDRGRPGSTSTIEFPVPTGSSVSLFT